MNTALIEVDRAVEKRPGKQAPGRVDLGVALELRFKKGRTFQEIADHFGVSPQAVHKRMRGFLTLLQSPESIKAFENAKTQVLTSIEMRLLSELVDRDKLKGASANNIAYALKQVFDMNRLEKGESTANIKEMLVFTVVRADGSEEPVSSATIAEASDLEPGQEPQDIDIQTPESEPEASGKQ